MAGIKVETAFAALYLAEMVNHASDLHIPHSGVSPIYRINGELTRLFDIKVDATMMDEFVSDMMNHDQISAPTRPRSTSPWAPVKWAVSVCERVPPAWHDRHGLPPYQGDHSLRELHFADESGTLRSKRGLVLVTGTTGSVNPPAGCVDDPDHINDTVA